MYYTPTLTCNPVFRDTQCPQFDGFMTKIALSLTGFFFNLSFHLSQVS